MKRAIAIALLSLPHATLASGYNPDDKDQFNTTGVCENCDLTTTSISPPSDSQPPYDLAGSNLSNTYVTIPNGTGSNFEGIIGIYMTFKSGTGSLSHANFRNAYLKDAALTCDFTYADFTGADLEGANFMNANLYGAIGMDLSNVASVCGAILSDGSTGEC